MERPLADPSRPARSAGPSGSPLAPAGWGVGSRSPPPRSPAPESSLTFAVVLGIPEPRAIEHAPLEPDLDVAFPGEADPAVELHGGARGLEGAVGDVRLREGRAALRVAGGAVLRVGRVPDEGPHRLDLAGEVREPVLHRLELRDRLAELLALSRVGERELEELLRGAEGVGREQHEPRVDHAPRRGLATRQDLAGRTLEADARERARAVDGVHRLDAHAARRALDERECAAGCPDDEEVRLRRARDPRLRARESTAPREGRPRRGLEAGVGLGEGDGTDRRARGEAREPTLALPGAPAGRDREPGERVAEEGPRQRGRAEHLGREREVEDLEPGAAVLLGEREARDAELREPVPE